jgi:hypothetical protein
MGAVLDQLVVWLEGDPQIAPCRAEDVDADASVIGYRLKKCWKLWSDIGLQLKSILLLQPGHADGVFCTRITHNYVHMQRRDGFFSQRIWKVDSVLRETGPSTMDGLRRIGTVRKA